MERSVESLLNLYRPENPLEKASTIPSPWYFDARIARLENEQVFAHAWQVAGRVDQVQEKGQFFTAELGDEPIVVARRRWLAARVLQCVPPPCSRGSDRSARLRQAVSLPISRMDLWK